MREKKAKHKGLQVAKVVRLTHPSCFLLLAGEVEKLHSHFPEFIATWVWRKSGSTIRGNPAGLGG